METSTPDTLEAKMLQQAQAEQEISEKFFSYDLPYQSELSLLPLIRVVENAAELGDTGERFLAQEVLRRLSAFPELREPISEFGALVEYKEIFDLLFLFVSPPALRKHQFMKVTRPFRSGHVYMSKALEQLITNNEVDFTFSEGENMAYCASLIRACCYILNRFYDQELSIDPPMLLSVRKSPSDPSRYFRTQINFDFVDVIAKKPLKPLTQKQIDHLLSNVYDPELWLEHLPPENFAFQGFILGNLVDITKDEALSRLKHDLLKRDAVLDADNVSKLERLLKTFFDIPDLRLGITAVDFPREYAVSHRYKIRFDFLADEVDDLLSDSNEGSIYHRVCKYREVLLIENLEDLKTKTSLEEKLLAQGIRSILIAPLFNSEERVIGLVELGAPKAFQLHSFIELQFKEIIGLFRTAVSRSREEIDNRIEAIIREEYTALHPSVEWRFTEAAFNLLEHRDRGEQMMPERIVFSNVYPFYAQADIVNSSVQRNQAIRMDLMLNLQKAEDLFEKLLNQVAFPLAKFVRDRIRLHKQQLDAEFNSSDETRIVDFLQQEAHPLLRQFREDYSDLRPGIDRYFRSLDPALGIIYDKRRDYEDSVTRINQVLGAFLDEKNEEIQQVLPHYYEKYKTDGVEYEMYAGQSLLRSHRFSPIHLQNLRLWQLIHLFEVTRLSERLRPELAVPMSTAQLIFAYTSPLNIQFRMEEKQFDVDGAYNVRYEILKKRIDKATIEGGAQRLTQKGKVAIVYLHDKDRQEYFNYLNYLASEGQIEDEIEDFLLDPVQGVQGLHALRVQVRLDYS